MKNKTKPSLLFLVLAIGVMAGARRADASTINAASCSQLDVQTAINETQDGDIVNVPLGTCSWSSAISVTRAVTVKGNGTNINGSGFSIKQSPAGLIRISGFNFNPTEGTNTQIYKTVINISGGYSDFPYRIDHNNFTTKTGYASPVVFIQMGGNSPGLIDHNSFSAPGNSEMIHNMGLGPEAPLDNQGWRDDVIPGGSDAVYIEDNNFINNNLSPSSNGAVYFWGNSAAQAYYGARTVFRYNHLLMSHVDQHGTPGMIGARWWEIYENTFEIVENRSQSSYIVARAGSGVIFNNHKTGYPNLWNAGNIYLYEEDGTVGNCAPYPSPCNGTGNCNCGTGPGDCMCQMVDPNQPDQTYPQKYQVGRGKNQISEPAYVWGNDSLMPVRSGSPNVQMGRDYYLSSKPNYTPYTYPHPLVSADNPVDTIAPAAPSGLVVK